MCRQLYFCAVTVIEWLIGVVDSGELLLIVDVGLDAELEGESGE